MKKSKSEILDEAQLNEAHNEKMRKIKEARDKMMNTKKMRTFNPNILI